MCVLEAGRKGEKSAWLSFERIHELLSTSQAGVRKVTANIIKHSSVIINQIDGGQNQEVLGIWK